ncbi:ATP-binding protein, partial [Streptomyces sp. 8K308]
MDPTTVGTRIASTAIAPLIKRLFRQDGPGAGLVDKPVRVSSLVSFKGEKHTLSTDDLRKIGKGVFQSWIKANEGQVELSAEAQRDMRFALGQALSRLGSLDMDDVQAVQLGPDGLARQLRGRRSDFRSFFSTEVWQAHNELLQTVCLHILNFFTQRSTFVARTLVEQSQQLDRAIARIDLLIERNPHPLAADTDFERRYTTYIATRHRELTIFGLDLDHAREWPLDASYVSLQAETPSGATTAPARADELLVRLDRPRVLLRGVAGSGKTTLAQWLAVTAVHPDPPETPDELLGRIPFLLP